PLCQPGHRPRHPPPGPTHAAMVRKLPLAPTSRSPVPRPDRSRTVTNPSGDLDDHVDLDRGAEGELGDADGAAGVPARLAEDRAEQLAGSVDHARLAGEPLGRGDEPAELDHP